MSVGAAETLVIGGGPAGAAAACCLAAAGLPVTLVERHSAPTAVVCGEFVGPAAQAELDHLLGDGHSDLGGAPVDQLAVSYRGHAAHARLPFEAQGLPRERLERALLARARAHGAVLLQGCTVSGGWSGARKHGARPSPAARRSRCHVSCSQPASTSCAATSAGPSRQRP